MTDYGKLDEYQKGTIAWFQDEVEGWIQGTLTKKSIVDQDVKLAFAIKSRDNEELTISTTLDKLMASKFVDLPPLKNPPILEGIDDLANLSHLHEPAVLHNVRLRYSQYDIYTYSGIVLIAMNPFQRLKLYSTEAMRAYSGKRRGELEPHLFAVAEEAYRAMIRDKKNQSIIVSGESGAGKTESAKYIMRYFATVDDFTNDNVGSKQNSNQDLADGKSSEIEEAVFSTNPIMESFGNAKTTRNDNSSRFGKYIEIMFSRQTSENASIRITGAKIRTYLLERSRLIFQPASERNYHIFYQICAGVPLAERKELGIANWETFFYLNQGNAGVVNGIDDVADFAVTQKALSTVGIPVSTQWDIFKTCAGLLHIGNIKVTKTRDEATIDDADPALETAARLLKIDKSEFKKWILKKQISTRSEKITTSLNQQQAIVGKDSVAKFIYSQLFDWLVKVINVNLNKEGGEGGSFIGVLDIYGFEHFKKNSFEQFCINYANEKLQQEFNQHVFKLEQEEYVAEKISWSFIDFNDNQPCIDMIENKLGVLDFLDEESRLPSGSDDSLITKLYQRFGSAEHKFFEKPRFGQRAFTIKHYACDVTYDIDGFIEKNKDTVSDEQLAVLGASTCDFLRDIVKIDVPEPKEEEVSRTPRGRGGGGQVKKPTLGSIFKASLVKLMETIRMTNVHYIRCIKPNQQKQPFGFEPQMVLSQLRACGVLETIHISCAGYPSRWTYGEFAGRYYFLVESKIYMGVDDPLKLTELVVKKQIKSEDKYQLGLTKIFFRAGQLAYLEKCRSEKLYQCHLLIQKTARGYLHRKKFRALRNAVVKLQSVTRGMIARTQYRNARRKNAAIKIQKFVKGFLARRKYKKIKRSTIIIQCTFRMHAALRTTRKLRVEKAARKIQRIYRGYRVRKVYNQQIRAVIFIQSCIRRRYAIRELKQLKIEAKSVGKIKEINFTLENKVISLSQAIIAKDNERKALEEKLVHAESQLAQWKEKFSAIENKNKAMTGKLNDDTTVLKKDLSDLNAAKESLHKENEKLTSMLKKRDMEMANLDEEANHLREEVKKLKEEVKSSAHKQDDTSLVNNLKKEVTSLREQMQRMLSGKYKGGEVRSNESASPATYSPSEPNSYGIAGSSSPPTYSSSLANGRLRASSRAKADMTDRTRNSLLHDKPGEQSTLENERSIRLLEDKDLEEEIIDSLITNLRIPLPSTQTVATRKEIFFPAHLIGTIANLLIVNDMSIRMQVIMANVMKAIQTLTMKFEDDYVSSFWLSNCFELLCVIKTTQEKESRLTRSNNENGRRGSDASEVERSLDKVRNDLDYLLVEIYHGWIKELKKRLSNMIVPAVIENQSLPGYICKQSGGLWGKWGKSSTSSSFSIEQLLNFLSKLAKTMRCYYMEDSMTRQILTELLRVIGVSSFNHLLMRKNFCTWKRGVQIQYNVSRLEEWCTSHGIAEATLHLQQLLQAAKLLTLNKTSPQDIETIFDVCFLLNPTQIKKLLSLYYAADFDSPLSPDLLKIVASRAIVNEKNDSLLLDLELSPEFAKPTSRLVDGIDRFVPAWISLPNISAVVSTF